MTDLTDAIAKAIFNEIERARMAAEPGVSLTRFEEVARAAHAEWTRANNLGIGTIQAGLTHSHAVDFALASRPDDVMRDNTHSWTHEGITWHAMSKMK